MKYLLNGRSLCYWINVLRLVNSNSHIGIKLELADVDSAKVVSSQCSEIIGFVFVVH